MSRSLAFGIARNSPQHLLCKSQHPHTAIDTLAKQCRAASLTAGGDESLPAIIHQAVREELQHFRSGGMSLHHHVVLVECRDNICHLNVLQW